jgi:Fibronectin type III domain
MQYHAFSRRAAATAVGMAVLLVGGTTTGAMAAVTSTSAPSAQQGTPTPPGAPIGLTATPGNGIATLSWAAPSSDGGSPVDRYVIEGGSSPSDDGILQKVDGHAATITGLTNGTTYYFRVLAENLYGDTASATVPVTPWGAGSVPGAPAGLKTSYGDSFIALSWSRPTTTGGSAITGYHVYLSLRSSMLGAKEYTTSATSFRFSDVENGSTYYIKVTALNAAGEGPGTAVTPVTPVPRAVPAQPGPSRPTGLTARARHGEVVLSWSPPKGGIKSSQGYLIYIGTRSGHEGAKPSVPYLIETDSYAIAPLKNGTRYYFQVALLTGTRVGPRSAEVSAVPGASASAPGQVGVTASTGTQTGSGGQGGSGGQAGSGGNETAQPSVSPLPGIDVGQDSSSSSPSTGLIVLLAALVLAAAAGCTTAVMLLRRRGHDRRYGPVPAPRRPYDDDQPTEQVRRPKEMNGPRYR